MRRAFLLVLVLGLSAVAVGAALAVLPPGGTFTDDDGNIHEGNIEAIAADGITKGCNPPTNDLYCPDSSVTRGQMAAFLTRALSLPATSTDFFSDDDGTTFEADINRLAAAEITKGCNPPTNDLYCPEGKVTRGQMAAFLVRAFGYADNGGGDLFVDDDDSIFEADIDRLGTAGVTKGCNPPENTRFCPDAYVLRDQMASFLARALGLQAITPPSPTSSTTSSTTTTTTTTTTSATTTTLPQVDLGYSVSGPDGPFSLDEERANAFAADSSLLGDPFQDVFYSWIDPSGGVVDACPVTVNCKREGYVYIGTTLFAVNFHFYIAGENREAGWYAFELWKGSGSPSTLIWRKNFELVP